MDSLLIPSYQSLFKGSLSQGARKTMKMGGNSDRIDFDGLNQDFFSSVLDLLQRRSKERDYLRLINWSAVGWWVLALLQMTTAILTEDSGGHHQFPKSGRKMSAIHCWLQCEQWGSTHRRRCNKRKFCLFYLLRSMEKTWELSMTLFLGPGLLYLQVSVPYADPNWIWHYSSHNR